MKKRQSGLTMISWVIIIALVGIQAVMALRIIPVYMNYGTVKSIMDGLRDDDDVTGKTAGEVKSLIQRRLQSNNLYDLIDNKQAFQFQQLSDGLQVNLYYEDRGPIYGNLEFIATFEHQVIIPKR